MKPFKILVNFNVPIDIDESLSWYNALCKLGYKLNDVIAVVNKLQSEQSSGYGPDNQPPYPVKSVNGKTGHIILNIDDIPALKDNLESLNSRITEFGENESELKNDIDAAKANVTQITARLDNYAITETESEFESEDKDALEASGTKLVFITNDKAPEKTVQKIYYMNGNEPWIFTHDNIKSMTFSEYGQLSVQDKIDDYYRGIVMYAVNNNNIITLYLLNSDGSVIAIAAGGGEGGAVTSVNGQTGSVNLTAGDIGAATTSSVADLESRISALEGELEPSNAYTPDNPPPYPVTSVNGQKGDVNITSESIGSVNKSDYDKKISELEDANTQLLGDIANASADAEEAMNQHNIVNPLKVSGNINIDEQTDLGYWSFAGGNAAITGTLPIGYPNNVPTAFYNMLAGADIVQYICYELEGEQKLWCRRYHNSSWGYWNELGKNGDYLYFDDSLNPGNASPVNANTLDGKTYDTIVNDITNKIKDDLKNTLDNINYKVGDTFTLNAGTYISVVGFITGGTRSLTFTLNLGKPAIASGVQISKLKAVVRYEGVYIKENASDGDEIDFIGQGYTVSPSNLNLQSGYLTFSASKNTVYANAKNNTVINVAITEIEIKFI